MIDFYSTKDKGHIADTVPDAELKSIAVQTKRQIYHTGISRDLGNHYEQPPILEEDNDTVEQATKLTSGKDKAFKHRINTLAAVRSACTEKLIEIVHVDSGNQTVDFGTKLLGPLDHWRAVGWIMGISAEYLSLFARAEKKFGKGRGRKVGAAAAATATAAAAGMDVETSGSEGESDTEAAGAYDTSEAWGTGVKPWDKEHGAEESEKHRQAASYKMEERHDAIVRNCERKKGTPED
jgi:hypothetical protein